MGWGAAQQYFEDNPGVVDSAEEAYDLLYSTRTREPNCERTCPLCGRRLKSKTGRDMHLTMYHGDKGEKALADLKGANA